jgi:hypothetical protein
MFELRLLSCAAALICCHNWQDRVNELTQYYAKAVKRLAANLKPPVPVANIYDPLMAPEDWRVRLGTHVIKRLAWPFKHTLVPSVCLKHTLGTIVTKFVLADSLAWHEESERPR